VFVSSATVWEIEIKRALGRLRAPDDVAGLVDEAGFTRLAITFDHGIAAGRLPALHRDPFDRMLVAQALADGLVLATADATLAGYGPAVLEVTRA
jgi:PIN domain nuclease of toxin-antitoxin system